MEKFEYEKPELEDLNELLFNFVSGEDGSSTPAGDDEAGEGGKD